MASRACILCGASGQRLTREHVWSLWYSKLNTGRQYTLESIVGRKNPTYRPTNSLDLQPRVLCKPCNNRWGADLEEAVRPRLAKMTNGESEVVTLPFARQLATWATLKVMASEYLAGMENLRFFNQADHGLYLRTKNRPPKNVYLWLGRYGGRHHEAGWILSNQSARRLPEDSTVGAFRHSVGYSMGQVFLQLFTVRLFPITDVQESRTIGFYNPFSFTGPWDEALTRIWPLPDARFTWPLEKVVKDKTFRAAVSRWHEQQPARRPKHGQPPKLPKGNR